jgi:hypothetical protein
MGQAKLGLDQVRVAAMQLTALCTRFGEHPCARGALASDIKGIEETFADLSFPLPDALIEVYRLTLGIPGILNDEPILWSPCNFTGPHIGFVAFLIDQDEDVNKEGVLWLGRGNEGDLILDRAGNCSLAPNFQPDGSVLLAAPTSFETAFLAYVEAHISEISREFAMSGR